MNKQINEGYSCLQLRQSEKFLMSSVSQARQYFELQLLQLLFQHQLFLNDSEKYKYLEKPKQRGNLIRGRYQHFLPTN